MSRAEVMRFLWIMVLVAAPFPATCRAQPADTNDLLSAWLDAQTHIQTWSADFTQTRRLKALTQPLTATGHVWFAAPNQFHWEIEKPSPTIALRQPDALWVIYPRLKRAEEYPLNTPDAGPWKDTLSLLDAGFPRSRSEVESRFAILGQGTTNGVHTITLQPTVEAARRIMPQIRIGFDTGTFHLRSTELQFADGSTMENVFSNALMNPPIAGSVFSFATNGYNVTQPFKK